MGGLPVSLLARHEAIRPNLGDHFLPVGFPVDELEGLHRYLRSRCNHPGRLLQVLPHPLLGPAGELSLLQLRVLHQLQVLFLQLEGLRLGPPGNCSEIGHLIELPGYQVLQLPVVGLDSFQLLLQLE
ncbi:unnamed protein product [Cuscuta campestris]|uniref:Uncharacterized protein n=1 Tax=Cuscuta campestris TaxID=132261 RepID=A0A484NQR0_9ASTE|nr:unnamed protein product [Cuscuta campestris]